jgi:ABC-2 type transport system ATP-binding protein
VPEVLVEVRNLKKRYGRIEALKGVSLDIARGERFALLGPNGAGKTTLIHILTTIMRGDEGTVTIAGDEVHRKPLQARRRLGVVFQEPSLDTRLTVAENLDFHGRVYGVPAAIRRERIPELLDIVELSKWRDHLVRSLSKGMQRRLEIARALVHDAELLVLDEPTVGLDAQTRYRMWETIAELQSRRNLTVLVTTHYIEEVDTCDRVCIIDHGEVLTTGSPSELKALHGNTTVHMVPNNPEVMQRIRAAFPQSEVRGDALVVGVASEAEARDLLRVYGPDLKSFNVENATLEGVFLSLTGSGVRDQMASGRDRLLAFGQRGGEHTR